MNNSENHVSISADNAIPYAIGSDLNAPSLTCELKVSKLTCLVGPHRSQLRAYLQMLAGITKPEQGKVEVFGQKTSALDQQAWQKVRAQVGYLSGASPLLSVEHGLMNVMLPALYHRHLSFRETADNARALLKQLKCDFEPTTYPASLNGYQRLQLSLARALILDPQILFLDVPFNDLGAKEREKMADLLAEYKESHAICMIGGLQYVRFLEQHAKQIIFISEFKIIKFNSWQSFKLADDPEIQALLRIL